MKDHLDEDHVPFNHKFAVISYFENQQSDSKDDILGQYKIKGVFKDLQRAQKAVETYPAESKKFNIYIVEMGKWNGFYSDEGITRVKGGNVIQSNDTLNEIMRDRKQHHEDAEAEHANRIQVTRHITDVKSSFQKALNLLEREKFIKIDHLETKELQAKEKEWSDRRRELRKEDNSEKKKEFKKEIIDFQMKQITSLRNIKELDNPVDTEEIRQAEKDKEIELFNKLQTQKDLHVVYTSVTKEDKKPFDNLEDLLIELLSDIETYTNYIENFEESLTLSKDDIKAQIKELETKLEQVDDTYSAFQFYTKDMYSKSPLKLE